MKFLIGVCFSLILFTSQNCKAKNLTPLQTLKKVRRMIQRECKLEVLPLSSETLRALGCDNPRTIISAINNFDFLEQRINLTEEDLNNWNNMTVSELRTLIQENQKIFSKAH
jgi:RNA processing factor Prp31